MMSYPTAQLRIVRGTIFYTTLAIAGVAAFIILFLLSNIGEVLIIPMAFGLAVGCLSGFQGLQFWLDLHAAPRSMTGMVIRKWQQSNFFFGQGFYVLIGEQTFEVEPTAFDGLHYGQTVAVLYYPHTNTVESIQKLEDDSGALGPTLRST